MAWLKVIAGGSEGKTFRLTEAPVTVGRGPVNVIQLQDGSLSRRHAAIQWLGAAHRLMDLKSENGVFVNGDKVVMHQLAHNDRIVLGASELIYESAPGIEYAEDHCRHRKEIGKQTAAETKGVDLEDIMSRLEGGGADLIADLLGPARSEKTEPARPSAGPEGKRRQILEKLRTAIEVAGGAHPPRFERDVMEGLTHGLEVDRAGILLKQGMQGVLKPVKTYQRPSEGAPQPPLLRDVVRETVRTMAALHLERGEGFAAAGQARRAAPWPVVCVPVVVRSVVLGVLYIDNALRPGTAFTRADLAFLTSLADLVGKAYGS